MTRIAVLTGWHSPYRLLTDWLCHLADDNGWIVQTVHYPGYNQPGQASDWELESLLDHLAAQIEPNSILLGWSLGGMLAARLAALPGFDLSGLVTLASNVQFQGQQSWQMPEKQFQQFLNRFQRQPDITLSKFQKLQVQGAANEHSEFSRLDAAGVDLTVDSDCALASLRLLGELDLRGQALTCPSLHLLGKEDALVQSACEMQWQQLSDQNRTQVVPGSHLFFLQPVMARVIQEFIDQVSR